MTLSFLTDPPTGNFYTFTGKKISRRKSKAAIKKFFDHFYDLSGAEELEGVTSLKQYYYHVLSEDEVDDTELNTDYSSRHETSSDHVEAQSSYFAPVSC